MFARTPFRSALAALAALLLAGLFGTAGYAAAGLPDFHGAEPATTDVEDENQCHGTVERTASGGTFVVVPDPGSAGECECTLLTGSAGKQTAALERRVRAWHDQPSCDAALGFVAASGSGQTTFMPGATFGATETHYGKFAPALLGLAFGADQARKGNRPDSPGG